jgi:DNA-binding MarR family transcriptional regulator
LGGFAQRESWHAICKLDGMTGGWPRQREHEGHDRDERQLARTPAGVGTNERRFNDALQKWSQIWRLRRKVNCDLKRFGSSFPQWRVLYATEQLTRGASDGVSELEVADCTDMDVSTVSSVLHRLEQKGLVDRGQEECEYTYHVLVTKAGRRLLADAQPSTVRFAEAMLELRVDHDEAGEEAGHPERAPDDHPARTPGAAAEP